MSKDDRGTKPMTPDPQMPQKRLRYFARATAGTEDIAWGEISNITGTQQIAVETRRIDFTYSGSPADLLALRSVDDICLYVSMTPGMPHIRAALQLIRDVMRELDVNSVVNGCRRVRPIPEMPCYTITASVLGRRNFNRFEVAEAARTGLQHNGWIYIENAPNHEPVDLDIRIIIEQDWMLVGIRLGAMPLHRRPYKLNSMPGSLKAPVAYCLCVLAGLKPADILLDPMCGAGTVAIEAAVNGAALVIAADLNPEATQSTQSNFANAGLNAPVMVADARRLPLPDQTIDCIVSNLPWGKQVALMSDLPALYAGVLREVERLLRVGGRGVFLTDQGDLFMPLLDSPPRLKLVSTREISLYGSHPTVYCVQKV